MPLVMIFVFAYLMELNWVRRHTGTAIRAPTSSRLAFYLKVSLCLIVSSVILNQLRISRQVASLLLQTAEPAATSDLSDPASIRTASTPITIGEKKNTGDLAEVIPEPAVVRAAAIVRNASTTPGGGAMAASQSAIEIIPQITNRPMRKQQVPRSLVSPVNTTGLEMGDRWIAGVKEMLLQEESNRKSHLKPGKGRKKRRNEIKKSFKRVRKRFDNVTAGDVDDPARWHAVSREDYNTTLKQARASMDEMIAKVNTDCVLWLVPPDTMTALEVEANDRDRSNWMKDAGSRPLLRFQCGDGDEKDDRWQDDPCGSANLCLVRSDPLVWKAYYADAHYGKSHYNHTDLRRRFEHPLPREEPGGPRKSAILTMVDSVKYLRNAQRTGKKRRPMSYYIWECFLNKASYALRTNRELYIWIGSFEGDDATRSVLHHRNNEVVSKTFGADCKPTSSDKNVVHYYKPIAFGALFRKLRAEQHGTEEEHRVWFVDADIFFNAEAFSSDDDKNLSLDDYFGISPQASLLGSQNPSGKENNILINGGLLGMKASATAPADPFDDWILNLSALWWYCRCGERDQIALWLLLYATWSAESYGSPGGGLAYPRIVFENYIYAWVAVPLHSRVFLPRLREAWSTAAASSSSSGWSTVPTTTHDGKPLFDGGDGFLRNEHGGGVYTYPLELPHVLLLPLDPFAVNATTGPFTAASADAGFSTLGLVLKDQPEKRALLTHAKNRDHVCYDFCCWPYLIRSVDGNPLITKTKSKTTEDSVEEHNDQDTGATDEKSEEDDDSIVDNETAPSAEEQEEEEGQEQSPDEEDDDGNEELADIEGPSSSGEEEENEQSDTADQDIASAEDEKGNKNGGAEEYSSANEEANARTS